MREWLERWRWAIAITALLLMGLGYAFWPEAVPVDTARVTRGPMAVGIADDGVTQAKDVFVVAAPVTGYVSRIELEPGDRVRRGMVITHITGRPSTPLDPRSQQEFRAMLDAARASEQGAGAALDQARRDQARAEELARRGFLPRAQLEAARARTAAAQATLLQSRADIMRMQALLADGGGAPSGTSIAVRAPASGAVLTVLSESEGVVMEGTRLMEIGDPARIEVVVDLLSRDAVQVKPGDRVEISQWGGPAPLTGRVERIEPFGKLKISALGIEEQRVNVIIGFDAASLDQAARLGHGYQIDATILLWSRPDALRVPIGALFRGGDGGWRVFAVQAGRARERAVKIGHINDSYGEVQDGLVADDQVVLNPGNTLGDGKRVKPR